MNDSRYREDVQRAIRRFVRDGFTTLADVCPRVAGADPRLVSELLAKVIAEPVSISAAAAVAKLEAQARTHAANFPRRLPAADPLCSQWWYTLDSVVELSSRVAHECDGAPVAFIGTPTIASHYVQRFGAPATALDLDPDVVDVLRMDSRLDARLYSADEPTPDDLRGRFAAAVLDPPWYPDLTRLFLARATEIGRAGTLVICTVPSRLTRPGLVEERTTLMNELLSRQFEFVALEPEAVTYRVPPFEMVAFDDVADFSGQPWRTGDLLVLRMTAATQAPETSPKAIPQPRRFARAPASLRVFLRGDRADPTLNEWTTRVPEFERNISTRLFDENRIALWSSSRRGARIRDARPVAVALEAWAGGANRGQAIRKLLDAGLDAQSSDEITLALHDMFALWTEDAKVPRRTAKQMEAQRQASLCPLVPTPTSREHPYSEDGFRLPYQRDRDRILWSHGLKRLAHKAQVFSTSEGDHLRQRLVHSMEVMQLASTIGNSFGLDRDLIEAGALAHDIGHAPFGHAGEHALNSILNAIDNDLGGFNHYEHGVDVVRWLEDIYQSAGSDAFLGLNLTPETCETIFKHTFSLTGSHRLCQEKLYATSKHQGFLPRGASHLEGQAVRIADKVSYLVSDLEDGIQMGVFSAFDLVKCRLFSRPPIDLVQASGETLFDRFVSQRRAILQVLMEDIILETQRRLETVVTLAEIRAAPRYTVDYSCDIARDVNEVYRKLQAGKLHVDSRVIAMNALAARIVSDLVLLFALFPELVESRFARSHAQLNDTEYMRHYERRCDVSGGAVQIPKRMLKGLSYEHTLGRKLVRGDDIRVAVRELVLARDYVASLSDRRARQLHDRFLAVA